MNSLFGVDLPTPVNFVIAFVVVLLLIGAATWLVRRFGATSVDAAARSRQPRLAVVDAAAIDGRRKLVIIRRDNVEHLLMIGGPTDVVVETNLVRAPTHAARDVPGVRNGIEPQLRAPAPLPDPSPWPMQPDPAVAPVHSARAERAHRVVMDDDDWQAPDEPVSPPPVPPVQVRPVRQPDALANLAHELTRSPVEQPVAPRPVHPEPVPAPVVAPVHAAPIAAAPPPVIAPPDQSLAEMAQRLEAALRRPGVQKIAEAASRGVSVAGEAKPAVRQPPRVVVASQTKGPANAAPQPARNIEQEMASLLNKPGKT